MNGQALVKAFIPLPGGGEAVYGPSGLMYYRHSDWLGSSRLASTPTRALYYDAAYAPFGESYAETGTTDRSFTGQNSDTVSGLADFLFREYSSAQQGRWISSDPAGVAAVDITNPQSWNRYVYVLSDPLAFFDPLGLDCSQSGAGLSCNFSVTVTGTLDPVPLNTIGGSEGFNGPVYRLLDSTDTGTDGGGSTCGTSGAHGGIVITYSGSGDAGAGLTGATVTGAIGGGVFYDRRTGFSGGGLASGGAAAYALSHQAGAPGQSSQPFSLGAFAGGGITITVTNARSVQQLRGPFSTLTIANVGIGPVKASVQVSWANGIWEFSVTPPIPYTNPGIGVSLFSHVVTTTKTTKTGCRPES